MCLHNKKLTERRTYEYMNKKRISFILLVLPLLFVPIKWFSHINVSPDSYGLTDANGIDVLLDRGLRIGLIWLLVIIIQILSLKCNTIIYPIISKLLLCSVLALYPFTYFENFDLVYRYFTTFYSIGFYFSIVSILSSIIIDIINKITTLNVKRN